MAKNSSRHLPIPHSGPAAATLGCVQGAGLFSRPAPCGALAAVAATRRRDQSVVGLIDPMRQRLPTPMGSIARGPRQVRVQPQRPSSRSAWIPEELLPEIAPPAAPYPSSPRSPSSWNGEFRAAYWSAVRNAGSALNRTRISSVTARSSTSG